MNRLVLTVKVKFDAAHHLKEYDGKCRNLHGHTYHLEVTVGRRDSRLVDHNEMVDDFGFIKGLIKRHVLDCYDHAYIAAKGDEVAEDLIERGMKVLFIDTPWGPNRSTAESMVVDISGRLVPCFTESGLKLEKLRLWETENSSVELALE